MRGEEGYSRFFAYMNLFVASMVVLVLADNLAVPLPRLGRRGHLLLPADRLLLPHRRERQRRDQGLPGHARRRRVHGHRPVHPAVAARHARHPGAARTRAAALRQRRPADRHGDADAARRRGRQVGAAAAADLARRRHGRPDAGLGADPRRHHGDRGRVPDRAHPRPVRARAGRAGTGRRGGRRDAADRRALRRWCRPTSSACWRTRP